jgi:hypothetical protein
MWSGGAGDGEIQQASMTVVVSGTGNGLNCRTGAGTGYPVISVLSDGTSLPPAPQPAMAGLRWYVVARTASLPRHTFR